MFQATDKYLYIPYCKGGGFDSKTRDLVELINLAVSIGRIPIISTMQTSYKHRLDDIQRKIPLVWDKYINLSATRILKIKHGAAIEEMSGPLRYVYEQDFDLGLYAENQIRYIGKAQLNDKENEHYPILCALRDDDIANLKFPISHEKVVAYLRDKQQMARNKKGKNVGGHGQRLDFYHASSSLFIAFSPSKEVNNLTDIVLKHFGTTREKMRFLSDNIYDFPRVDQKRTNLLFSKDSGCYACMHVRYGPNPGLARKFLEESSDLEKYIKQVMKKVYKRHNRNLPLYIMSNIMKDGYFDFLKPRYDIYRYTDFKKLREKFSENNADSNLLYAVEKNLMRYAIIKIFPYKRNLFTFEGPWYLKGIKGEGQKVLLRKNRKTKIQKSKRPIQE